MSNRSLSTSAKRSEASALFERFGQDTVSGQSLEPGLNYWMYGDAACVAYQDTGGSWVAVGGPMCAPEQRRETMAAFAKAAKVAGRRVRFFCIEAHPEEKNSDWQEEWKCVAIGKQPEWDPARWNEALASKKSLREQLRRARAKKVEIREVDRKTLIDPESTVHKQVRRMVRDWQKNQAMAPMSFLVSLDLFGNPDRKRYFVAERGGKVVAILFAMEIPARQGWFFEDVLRAHDAPNGSIELLFDFAMRAAHSEDIAVVSFGLAPLSGAISPWLAAIRDHSRWLYDFEGLRAFKTKLLPSEWKPVYLSFPKKEKGVVATIDSLTAFAGGSWIRFGWNTVVHAQPILIWWLALLLIPWMVLLGNVPTLDWFPSPEVQAGWIGFDVVLCGGLIHLATAWRRRRAQFWALICALDTTMGSLQYWHYNQHHFSGILQTLIALFAVLAPLGAAVILMIGAISRDRLYLAAPKA